MLRTILPLAVAALLASAADAFVLGPSLPKVCHHGRERNAEHPALMNAELGALVADRLPAAVRRLPQGATAHSFAPVHAL